VLGAVLSLTLPVVALVPLGAQEPPPDDYSLDGEDSPAWYIAEAFLSQAAGWHEHAPDAYQDWCRTLGIDPSWPSAARLAEAYGPFEKEYLQRVKEYGVVQTGLDPNDWRPAAAGALFAEAFLQLRADGLRWELDAFLVLLRKEVGPTFTRYSDRPYGTPERQRRQNLFWEALEAMVPEAAEIPPERRQR
jgi:hypothetical protein